MIGQRHCPFCKVSAVRGCAHLAMAVEAREFVRRCIELCEGQRQWEALLASRRKRIGVAGGWTPEREDFTWLESAFRDEFLTNLAWFGTIDYEWRTGDQPERGGFWV